MSVGASGIYSEAQALSRHVESAPHRVADGRPGASAQGEPRRDAYVLVEQTRRETRLVGAARDPSENMAVAPCRDATRLSQKSAVTLADLRDEPLVLPSQQTLPGMSALMRAAFHQAKITPHRGPRRRTIRHDDLPNRRPCRRSRSRANRRHGKIQIKAGKMLSSITRKARV